MSDESDPREEVATKRLIWRCPTCSENWCLEGQRCTQCKAAMEEDEFRKEIGQ